MPAASRVSLRNPGAVDAVDLLVWNAHANGPVVLLAHGAGSRADHPVHVGVCAAVADAGLTVAAFNFPYAQARRRSPDRAERLVDCYRDAADAVAAAFADRPVIAGGRSMGGRMASLLAADGYPFAGLALLNYPLVSARGGADSEPRVGHWPRLTVPVLFVHGTRDRLLPPAVFDRHRNALTVPVAVHVVDDADHMFKVPARAGRTAGDVFAEVAGAVAGWATTVPSVHQ